jgi:LmbE family N-acetylglucosaminyl deacetylase
MRDPLRLLCVLAHPDDESLGTGGILAKYGAEGVETHLLTATRGEKGRIGDERPGAAIAAPIRERELRRAAEVLGVRSLHFLDYQDGDLDRADPREAVARIAAHLRAIRPQVVVTFAADGAYGHPDHVAISQLTGAALVAAADPDFAAGDGGGAAAPHRVSKHYWFVSTPGAWEAYQFAFKELVAQVDGVVRRANPWPEWSVTARIDTRTHWETVWRAVQCHQSQIAGYQRLGELPPEMHEALWGTQTLYRVFSLVNGGRALEQDLFAGLREPG